MSEHKLGVEILSSGPVTVEEGTAYEWGENGQTVYVEGDEVAAIQIYRNGKVAYFLRIATDGSLILTTYQGRLTTTLDTNLHLTPTHPWN
jgi:hypothetical protein